jgi:hypothetical protein
MDNRLIFLYYLMTDGVTKKDNKSQLLDSGLSAKAGT